MRVTPPWVWEEYQEHNNNNNNSSKGSKGREWIYFTQSRRWLAFEWFHGHNVLGAVVADPRTGGCHDGLLEDRVSENQGAESTLAYLAAVIDVRLLAAELPREQRVRTGAKA